MQDCRFSFLQRGKFGSSSTKPVSVGQEDTLRKEPHKNVCLTRKWKGKNKDKTKKKKKAKANRTFGGTIFLLLGSVRTLAIAG